MPVAPDTQFPYTKVKNFTTFSLTLSPTQIFPGYSPLPTLTQMVFSSTLYILHLAFQDDLSWKFYFH